MDADSELSEIAALLAEHLRGEMDLGLRDLPDVSASLREGTLDAPPIAPAPPATPAVIEPAIAPPAPERAVASPSASVSSSPATPSTADARARLAVLAEEAAACTRCGLHAGRTKSVFARGNPDAPVVAFVGEGPGYHEDQQGLPFVGKAGQLLDRMIAAMGLAEHEVYICNVVKCRPPENRTPNPDEAAACMPYLEGQLAAVQPQVIVALGRHAAENLGAGQPGWRGRWTSYGALPVMSTYHPAYLLRNPENKRAVWEDLQAVVKRLGRELPPR